jgi:hypothetical protein
MDLERRDVDNRAKLCRGPIMAACALGLAVISITLSHSSPSTFRFGLGEKEDVRPQLTTRLRMLEIEELVRAEERVKGIRAELGADTQVTSAARSHSLNLEVLAHSKWDYFPRLFPAPEEPVRPKKDTGELKHKQEVKAMKDARIVKSVPPARKASNFAAPEEIMSKQEVNAEKAADAQIVKELQQAENNKNRAQSEQAMKNEKLMMRLENVEKSEKAEISKWREQQTEAWEIEKIRQANKTEVASSEQLEIEQRAAQTRKERESAKAEDEKIRMAEVRAAEASTKHTNEVHSKKAAFVQESDKASASKLKTEMNLLKAADALDQKMRKEQARLIIESKREGHAVDKPEKPRKEAANRAHKRSSDQELHTDQEFIRQEADKEWQRRVTAALNTKAQQTPLKENQNLADYLVAGHDHTVSSTNIDYITGFVRKNFFVGKSQTKAHQNFDFWDNFAITRCNKYWRKQKRQASWTVRHRTFWTICDTTKTMFIERYCPTKPSPSRMFLPCFTMQP